MIEGPLVFVDIDTQRDFLDPDGRLSIQGATNILPRLARLTSFAQKNEIPILATSCAHQPDAPEFTRFAPHCLVGTKGQDRVPETKVPGTRVFRHGERLEGNLPPHLTLEKQDIDIFRHPDADRLIAWYNRGGPTFVVYGVATDYCVKAAVEGLRECGCRTALVVDAIRAIDQTRETELLTEFASSGTLLTLTEIVCERRQPQKVGTVKVGIGAMPVR